MTSTIYFIISFIVFCIAWVAIYIHDNPIDLLDMIITGSFIAGIIGVAWPFTITVIILLSISKFILWILKGVSK